MKRKRRLGRPGEKPIIHVPKEVYLNKDRLDLNNKRRRTATTSGGGLNGFIFDTDLIGSSVFSIQAQVHSKHYQPCSRMIRKFKGSYALENGSVLMEEESRITKEEKPSLSRTSLLI
nr:CFF_HP1_G0031220.mRNA.1.CDS.1 [Saccharomyces cerevisiae]